MYGKNHIKLIFCKFIQKGKSMCGECDSMYRLRKENCLAM